MEDNNQIAVMLIALAGDSKSDAMAAMDAAQVGLFDKAGELLKKSEASMHKAHEIHTQFLVKEARKEELTMTLMLVHASTHLVSAELTHEFAARIVKIYQEVKKID